MICWVLYDIESNKARTKSAKACLRAGLNRVQYSCFVGDIEESEKDALRVVLEDLIDEEKDKVYIFPMNRNEFSQTILLGQAFDKKYVSGGVKNILL